MWWVVCSQTLISTAIAWACFHLAIACQYLGGYVYPNICQTKVSMLTQTTYLNLMFPQLSRLPWTHCGLHCHHCGRWQSSCCLSWWWDLACWIHNISVHQTQMRLGHSQIYRKNGTLYQNSRRWAWSSVLILRQPQGSRSDNVEVILILICSDYLVHVVRISSRIVWSLYFSW